MCFFVRMLVNQQITGFGYYIQYNYKENKRYEKVDDNNEKDRNCVNFLKTKEELKDFEQVIIEGIRRGFDESRSKVEESCQNKAIDNDDTDYIEAAKHWAKNQKQSFQ